jgi:hypothetical protein
MMPKVSALSLYRQLLYSACVVGLFSHVCAENQAGHTLTISLPRHFSIDLNETALSQAFPLIPATDDITTQSLRIRSTTSWLLLASFIPCRKSDPPRLSLSTLSLSTAQKSEARSLKPYPRALAVGQPTSGWTQLTINLYLTPPASDTPCQSLLLYSFIQP